MKNLRSVIAIALICSVLFSNGVYAEELFKASKPAKRVLNTDAVFTDVLNQVVVPDIVVNDEASEPSFEEVIKESTPAVDIQPVEESATPVVEDVQPAENIDLSGVDENTTKGLSRKEKNESDDDSFAVQGLVLPDIPAYSEEDIILLAKLIWHESEGEPREGKIAVGEVVLNRIKSKFFPDTVYDVIYQKGQFSHVKYVEFETPDEETVQIADDVLNRGLKILNNSGVLYFRNPMKTSKVPASTEKNWGRHKYFTYYGNHAFYIHSPKKYSPFEKKSSRVKAKKAEPSVTPDVVENQPTEQVSIPVEVNLDALGVSSEKTEIVDFSTFDTPLMVVVEGEPAVPLVPVQEAVAQN